MTAVFRKPLSATLSPLLVSFSSLSSSCLGAEMRLNAVACTPLFTILQRQQRDRSARECQMKTAVRYCVGSACAIIVHRQALRSPFCVCYAAHGGCGERTSEVWPGVSI